MFPSIPQPTSNFSMEQNIMNSLTAMHSKMDAVLTELSTVKAELTTVKERVFEVEGDLKSAYSEIFNLKDKVNYMEQRERALTVRIFGVPLSPDEKDSLEPAKAAAKTAYDRVLKPILAAAKDKAILPTIPVIANIITEAYRIKSRNPSSIKPTPIVVKLVSPNIKAAIFRCRRDAMPQPSPAETEAGLRRFHLAEDLTSSTYDFLMQLREHPKTERAWTTDGQVRFTKKGDSSGFVHKVKCIFDNIDSLF